MVAVVVVPVVHHDVVVVVRRFGIFVVVVVVVVLFACLASFDAFVLVFCIGSLFGFDNLAQSADPLFGRQVAEFIAMATFRFRILLLTISHRKSNEGRKE